MTWEQSIEQQQTTLQASTFLLCTERRGIIVVEGHNDSFVAKTREEGAHYLHNGCLLMGSMSQAPF